MPKSGERRKQVEEMETKKVGEIMIPLDKYPHVYEHTTLRQAIQEMDKYQNDRGGKKSLPRVILVFNRNEDLVGVARRRDILRGLEPEFLVSKPVSHQKSLFDVQCDPNLSEMSYGSLAKGIFERAKKPVCEVMMPAEVTIEYDDHITKAINEMVDNNKSLLPVLKNGRVVGVVCSVDVFHEVAKLVLDSEEK